MACSVTRPQLTRKPLVGLQSMLLPTIYQWTEFWLGQTRIFEYSISNPGFVKPYISIGLSSQICRFVLEYSNIWQRYDSINGRFSTKQEEKGGRWRWLLLYYSTSIWEEWGCTGWTWMIFESATTGFVDSGSVVIWTAWTDMCRLRDRRNRLSTEWAVVPPSSRVAAIPEEAVGNAIPPSDRIFTTPTQCHCFVTELLWISLCALGAAFHTPWIGMCRTTGSMHHVAGNDVV